jgi:hypothetical protein
MRRQSEDAILGREKERGCPVRDTGPGFREGYLVRISFRLSRTPSAVKLRK